ncbi:MAG TPA: glutamate racemase [Candidatus Avamphibacillus sp.]|nr:glutamate racemase [Candidatus Avamphibacillus sp.]
MKQAIGVIDSGVGGLTVASELMRQLPNEKLIYLGDTLRCPYGSRPEEEIKQFTWNMVHFLMEKDIKLLVIACNTATAYTLIDLQQKLDIPVIGVIQPGARAAINATKNKRIGIIGTEGTIRSNAYTKALHMINADITVISGSCPLFVPMVEKGILSGPEAYQTVNEGLQSMKDSADIDTLVLGCTHYPLIKDVIQDVVGEHVQLISSSEETARETSAILELHDLLNKDDTFFEHQFYTTGELSIFQKLTTNIFSHHLEYLSKIKIDKVSI